MLILARETGERILIFENGEMLGTVKVLEVSRNGVKLGIEAPQRIRFVREEVYRREKRESTEQDVP